MGELVVVGLIAASLGAVVGFVAGLLAFGLGLMAGKPTPSPLEDRMDALLTVLESRAERE